MKTILLLFFSTGLFAQAQNLSIKISPVKVVTVQLPVHHNIVEIRPGLEKEFFSFSMLKSNLFILQATSTKKFPTSNLTILCDSAIFYVDIVHSLEIDKYFYEIPNTSGIAISPSQTNTVRTVRPPTKTVKNVTTTPVTNELIPAYELSTLTPSDTLYYTKDRLTLGTESNGVLAYVNNLVGNDDFISISIKITNTSPVTFHSDLINWFILTKRKKSATSIDDDDDSTPYLELNNFPVSVAPDETALFVMRFRKFSLDSNNSLKLIIGEGQGRRNISFEIKAKKFYNSIKYY